MACFNNWSVYDMYNMGQAVRKDMIKGKDSFPYDFKYIKDIVATKVSMFSYKNLDKVIPEMTDSIIETALLFSPLLCFYKDNNLGWVLCRYSYLEYVWVKKAGSICFPPSMDIHSLSYFTATIENI